MREPRCSNLVPIVVIIALAPGAATRADDGPRPPAATRPVTTTANSAVSLLRSDPAPPPPEADAAAPTAEPPQMPLGEAPAVLAGAPTDLGVLRSASSRPLGSPPPAEPVERDRTLPEDESGGLVADAVRVGGGLVVVIGLILLLRLAVRHGSLGAMVGRAGRPSGLCEVLARYPVGKGQQLVLLKLARRLLLVHQSGSSMRTLTEMTEPEEVAAVLARVEAASRRGTNAFRSSLQQFETEHRLRTTPRPAVFAPDGTPEVVDLTQHPHAALRRLIEGKKAGPAGAGPAGAGDAGVEGARA